MSRNARAVALEITGGPPARPVRALLAGVAALGLVLLAGPRAGAAGRPVEGLLVQVPASITTESTARLRSAVHGPLKRFEQGAGRQRGQFWLVLDFNPDGQSSECDDFGACLGLAKYIRSLSAQVAGVSTVAYVRGDVRQHSVLPVLACTRIEMSSRGRLGQVAVGGRPLDRIEVTAYEDFARGRFDPLLVRKMYDPTLEVYQAVADRRVRLPVPFGQGAVAVSLPARGRGLFDGRERPAGSQLVLEAGDTALYDLKLIREKNLGLPAQAPINTIDELRATYSLPRGVAQRQLDRTVCWRVPVEGAITGEVAEQTRRRVKRALQGRANLLILELRCAGGDAGEAHELGLFLSGLNEGREDSPVETVAYVTSEARNLAVFLAFGCQKIVMQYDPGAEEAGGDASGPGAGEARLGEFGLYLKERPGLEDTLRRNLGDLAARQGYPAALAAGLFSRDLRIHVAERGVGAGGRLLMTEEDLRAEREQAAAEGRKPAWASVGLVKPWKGGERYEGAHLTLTARQAQELGLADVVKDFNQLCEREGVAPGQVRAPSAEWLDGLGDFLRNPWTSVLLVMVGITCLILELKMPGIGLPGVVAAICFVLFFWAHSQLNGQITWLALLLFILGLVLIGLEVFVLPGFGVCGISGTLLVLASLGLVAYGHWPRTGSEWVSFGQKLSPFGVSLLGALTAVALIVRYLPHIPVLNRLMSRLPEEGEGGEAVVEIPIHAELQELLGAIGVAATPLRPAGKSQFGESFVDVVAEGRYIMPGTRVQVVEVEGNRVVVKEV